MKGLRDVGREENGSGCKNASSSKELTGNCEPPNREASQPSFPAKLFDGLGRFEKPKSDSVKQRASARLRCVT